MKVRVLEIPIRYGNKTYRMGEEFEINKTELKGIESLVEVTEEEETKEDEKEDAKKEKPKEKVTKGSKK